jgi:hypothetical protein
MERKGKAERLINVQHQTVPSIYSYLPGDPEEKRDDVLTADRAPSFSRIFTSNQETIKVFGNTWLEAVFRDFPPPNFT